MTDKLISNLALPVTLQLEITNKCNMNCGFCYNNSTKENPLDVTHQEWLEFSKSVVNFGGVFQCIISGGEPTLFKRNVIDIMDIYHSDGSIFTLISNGSGIDGVFAKQLSKFRWYWVQISLDSHLPEKHDAIRKKKGAWRQAVLAVEFLKNNNIPVSIASVISKDNIEDMEDIIRLALSINVDQIIFSSVLYSGRASLNKEYFLTEKAFILKFEELNKKYKNQIILKRAATHSEQMKNIHDQPPASLIVRPNGDVKLDCTLPFIIGNIRENNIIEIWAKAKKLYEEESFKEYIKNALTDKFSVVANNTNNDIRY